MGEQRGGREKTKEESECMCVTEVIMRSLTASPSWWGMDAN